MTNGISNRTFAPHVITLEKTTNAAVVLTVSPKAVLQEHTW